MIADTERAAAYPSILLGILLETYVPDELDRESIIQLIGYIAEDAEKEGYAEGYGDGWKDGRTHDEWMAAKNDGESE